MSLDFTSRTAFIDDTFRYFNDSRICSLGGLLSDPRYNTIYKVLDNNGLKEYAPFFNLAINRTIIVYKKSEGRFYLIKLDDNQIGLICNRFFIQSLGFLESSFKVSRTDGRILANDHPMSMYIGLRTSTINRPDNRSPIITPYYFNMSDSNATSIVAEFGKMLDSYVDAIKKEDDDDCFNASEAKEQNQLLCNNILSRYQVFDKPYSDHDDLMTIKSAKEYYRGNI